MLSDLLFRVRSLFQKKSMERELEDELRFHFEHQREKYIKQGLRYEDATRKARLEFGGVDQIKEECRQARGVSIVESMLKDIFYALRSWRRSPIFASVAIFSLALGIGANTAIFSIVDALVFRSLPVQHPEELEQLQDKYISYPMYRDIKDSNGVFSGMLARFTTPGTLANNDQVRRGVAEIASGNYFSVLGVTPRLGRTFAEDEDRVPLSKPVAVISYRCWQDLMSADPDVVGKTIRIDNYPFTVIGVAPSGFYGLEVDGATDVWVPLMMQPKVMPGVEDELALNDSHWFWLTIFGRRAAGVTEKQAEAGLNVPYLRQMEELGTPKEDLQEQALHLEPAGKGISRLRADLRPSLYILMVVVGLVLLIACANIANLLLARCISRQKEIAVRLALGAGRARLIRQLLTESMLLSLTGGALGIVVSIWGVRLLLGFLPGKRIPLAVDAGVGLRVLGFAIAISLFTGLIFGLVPALQTVRLDLTTTLKDEIALVIGSRRFELRKGLVIFQVALSLVLLIVAGLFLRGLRNAASTEIGLNTESVLMASLDPSLSGYSQVQAENFYRQLVARLREIPGVKAVGTSNSALLSGSYNELTLMAPGRPAPPPDRRQTMYNEVGGDFFNVAGIQINSGRAFGSQDSPGTSRVAIINKTTARNFFDEDNPVGRKLRFGRMQIEIIGVAADSKYTQVTEKTPRIIYFSSEQIEDASSNRTIYLKTSDDPTRYIATLKDAVSSLDKNLPIYNIKTFEQQKAESLTRERLTASLSSFFGGLALLLAAVGLYGVISYTVQRRTREIGIRMVMGAGRAGIIWMILRSALALSIIGIGVGVLLSRWLSGFVASQLHGLGTTDPLTIVVSSVVLLAVAIAAATIPAWNASRVDPTVALRYE